MRILKIIHGYPPEYNAGSEVYTEAVVKEFSKSNDVILVSRYENEFEQDYHTTVTKSENIHHYKINNPRNRDAFNDSKINNIIEEICIRHEPHICHIGHLNHLSIGLIKTINKLRIKIVFTLHDYWLLCPRGQFLQRKINPKDTLYNLCPGQDNKRCAEKCYYIYNSGLDENEKSELTHWESWIEKRMSFTQEAIDLVDLFIAPSQYIYEKFITTIPRIRKKIIFESYGFKKIKYRKTATSKIIIAYIGTHIPAKGVNLLIEAFTKIDSNNSTLKIYGKETNYSNHLKKLASTDQRIIFCGEYQNGDINNILADVSCIVVPSIWEENAPLVIHEALQMKTPVVTANYGGMKELIRDGVNGLLFDHRNVDSLKYVLDMIVNKNKLSTLSNISYLNNLDNEVPDIYEHCQRLIKYYLELLNINLWRITLDTNPEDCNLACIMCEEHSPYSKFKNELYSQNGREPRRMSTEILEKSLSEARNMKIKEIIPSTMGEPLLYKHINYLFDELKSSGINLNLTTNGTFPIKTIEEWGSLILPIGSDVKISFNGISKETQEKIMIKSKLEDSFEKIERFITERDIIHKQTGKYCSITLQITFMTLNLNEIPEIVKYACSLGIDRVKGHHLWDHFSEIKPYKISGSYIEKWNNIVSECFSIIDKHNSNNNKKIKLENFNKIIKSESSSIPEDYECPFLGKEIWISAKGKISPCCAPDHLREELGDFGNINNISINSAIASTAYIDLVQNYKSKSLCQKCLMRKPVE